MSLVNDMLRDLDRRKRLHSHQSERADIVVHRSVSVAATSRLAMFIAAGFIFMAGLSAGYFVFGS